MSSRILRHTFARLRCNMLAYTLVRHECHSLRRLPAPAIAQQFSCGFSNSTKLKINTSPEDTKARNIFAALQSDMATRKRVLTQGLEEFLRLSDDISVTELEVLLRCPAYLVSERLLKRQEVLSRIWEKRPAEVSPQLLLTYLEACRDTASPIDFEAFLKENLPKEALQVLLEVACQVGSFEKAGAIVKQIKAQYSLDERVFAALINCHARSRDFDDLQGILKSMEDAKVERTGLSYANLYEVYAMKSPKEAEELLRSKIQLFQPADLKKILLSTLQNSSSEETVAFILKQMAPEVLQSQNLDPVFLNICSQLILEGKLDRVEILLKLLPTPEYPQNVDIDVYGAVLLEEVIKNCPKALPGLLKICRLLIESGKNTFALHIAAGSALKQSSSLTLELFKALRTIEPLRPHFFWPILLQANGVHGEKGTLDTLKLMTSLDVQVDPETVSFYVLPKLAISFKSVPNGVKELEAAGLKTAHFFTPLLSQLIFQQRFSEILNLVSLYSTKVDTEQLVHPLITAFGLQKGHRNFSQVFAKILHVLKERASDPKHDLAGHLTMQLISSPKTQGEHLSLTRFIEELIKVQLKMSKHAVDAVQRHLTKVLTPEKVKMIDFKELVDRRVAVPEARLPESGIKHPRDMNLSELECHYTELESKRLNTRGVLRRLLQLYVREGKLEQALQTKKKCDELKLELSPGMLASVFDLFVRTKNIEGASQTLRKLNTKFPAFLIDEHKIVDFATVLVEAGNLEEAKKVLEQRALVTEIIGGDGISKNIWALLDEVAKRADPKTETNVTKKFFELLEKRGYCQHQNTALGPVLKELLNKNDIRGAVREFKEICTSHKTTPLFKQLMTLLVEIMNNEEPQARYGVSKDEAMTLLQEVVTAGTSVHGPSGVNVNLVVAFAEQGTDKQLRKMLIDPSMRLNPESLKRQCEYLNASRKIDALLRLARCSRGLGFMQEQKILQMVLESLVQQNDCEGALSLFENLNADDEFKVSADFVKTLVDLLRKNNLELPTSVALHAK